MLKGYKLQETLLNALCQEQVPVSVSLRNEAKLEGQIASFDQYAILLKSPALHMVYKHAIFLSFPHVTSSCRRSLDLSLRPKANRKKRGKVVPSVEPAVLNRLPGLTYCSVAAVPLLLETRRRSNIRTASFSRCLGFERPLSACLPGWQAPTLP